MALEDLIKLGIEINLVGDIIDNLKGVQEGIEGVSRALTGLASLEAFKGLREGFESAVDAASEMQDAQARLGSASDLTAAQIANLSAHASALAETNYKVTSSGYLDAYASAYQILKSTADAQVLVDNAFKVSAATGSDATNIVRLMTTMYENLGISSTELANLLGGARKEFGLSGEQLQQFTTFMSRTSEAAKKTGTDVATMMAIAGESGRLIPGGRGMQQMMSFIETLPERAREMGLNENDTIVGMLSTIRTRLASLSGPQLIEMERVMGVSGPMGDALLKLTDGLDKVGDAALKLGAAGPSVLLGEIATMSSTLTASTERLSHAWGNFRETIGDPLLVRLENFASMLLGLIDRVNEFAQTHKWVTEWAVPVAGAIAAVTAGLGIMGTAISLIGSAFGGLAFLLGPVGLIIAALAAVGFAVYEVYEHWSQLVSWFRNTSASDMGKEFADMLMNGVEAVGTFLIDVTMAIVDKIKSIKWLDVGWSIIKLIGEGMLGGIEFVGGISSRIAERIAGFFKGHSPPAMGPLHDIVRIPLTTTIAESLQPETVTTAMRRVALATALVMSPMMHMTAAMAAVPPSQAGGGRTSSFNITYAPIIQVGSSASVDDFSAALEKHSKQIVDTMQRELDRFSRERF